MLLGEAAFLYSAADRSADIGAGVTSIVITVCQLGQFARSLPTSITIPL
jgi:hypothetical protein